MIKTKLRDTIRRPWNIPLRSVFAGKKSYSLNHFSNSGINHSSSNINYFNGSNSAQDLEQRRILIEQAILQQHNIQKKGGLSPKSFLIILVISLLGGAGLYTSVRFSRNESAFFPVWLQSKKRDLAPNEVNIDQLRSKTEYKLLELLSSNDLVKRRFGLPLMLDKCDQFDCWAENKYPTLSGFELSRDNLVPKFTSKPIKSKEKVEELLDSLGTKFSKIKNVPSSTNIHEVPMLDSQGNDISDQVFDVRFQGATKIQGISNRRNPNVHFQSQGTIIFTGVVDSEHKNSVKIISAELLQEDSEDNLKLW